MGSKHHHLRGLLTDAIVELCRREAFYVEELRIEGTVCLVSDRSSVLIAQITEQVGEKLADVGDLELPLLDTNDVVDNGGENEPDALAENAKSTENAADSQAQTSGKAFKTTMVYPRERMDGKYCCPFCPKKYRFKHSLKDHMNMHMGRKPHVCKHCHVSFTHLSSLCAHMKRLHTQHMSTEHYCQLCGERCLNEHSLRQHIARMHKKTLAENHDSTAGESMDTAETAAKKVHSNTEGTKRETADEDHSQLLQPKQEVPDPNGPEPGEIAQHDPLDTKPPCHMQYNTMLDPTKAIPVPDDFLGSFPQQGVTMIPTMEQLMRSLPHGAALMPMSGMPTSMPYQSFTSSPSATTASPVSSASFPGTPPRNQDFDRTKDGKFKCPFCEKAYNFKHTLKDHINKHTGRRPHVCKHCGDSFAHLASLCAHIKRRHDEQISNDFLCDICQEKFMNYQSLKQHYTWRHKSMKVPIKLPTTSPTSLTTHTSPTQAPIPSTDFQSPPAAPDISLPGMSTQWDLPVATTSNPVFPGPTPTFSSNSEPNSRQELDDEPDLSYLAGLSLPGDFTASDIDDLAVTEKSPAKDFGSSSPSSGLPRSIAMYFEEIDVQTEQGHYRYRCKMCGNMFKVRNSLYEHLNSHFGKRPHVCPYCGDSFAHHSSLHNHVRNRHTFISREEKEATFKHQCVTCAKKFRYPSELDRHLKTNPDHVANNGDAATAGQGV